MNPSTNYECGMLVEGFDSDPMIMMTYNPPYYAALMERAGLRKAKDLLRLSEQRQHHRHGRRSIAWPSARLAANGVRVRPIDMKNFEADVERVWDVYNAAWSRNWGFVPMSREEFAADGQGNEADPQARTGADRRGGGPRGGVCPGPAGRQPGAETGARAGCSPQGCSKSCIINV